MTLSELPDADPASTEAGADTGALRVLVAHAGAELYGADRQMLQSLAAFGEGGWDVTVALPERGPLCEQLTGVDVRVVRVPVLRRALLRPAGLLGLVARTPAAIVRLVRLIRAVDPHVVFVNTVTLPHWALAARIARRRVVVHVHEAEESSPGRSRGPLYWPLLLAHRVVANSGVTREVIERAAPAVRERMRVVVNGVPDPGAQSRGAVVPGRLAVVSRLSPRKGIDDAIEALRLLVAGGRDVSLELCGSVFPGYEWYEEQLRRQVADAGLQDRVRFAGFVSSVGPALARAELVLAPSHGESFGNSAVEAMFAERPVVASAVQSLAEVIVDGRTGVLVPAREPQAFAAAAAALLDDPHRAAGIARQARAAALEHYSVERYGRALRAAVTDGMPAAFSGQPAQDPIDTCSGNVLPGEFRRISAYRQRGRAPVAPGCVR